MQYEIQIDELNGGTRGKENKSIGIEEKRGGAGCGVRCGRRKSKKMEGNRRRGKRERMTEGARCKV